MAQSTRRAAAFDENAVRNGNGPTINKPLLNGIKQRAALGDMVNRWKNSSIGLEKQQAAIKKPALKEVNRNKIEPTKKLSGNDLHAPTTTTTTTSSTNSQLTLNQSNLREIKPRVDTHWKRNPIQTTTSSSTLINTATSKITRTDTTKLTNHKSGVTIEKTRAIITETVGVLRPAAQRIQVRPIIRKDSLRSTSSNKVSAISTSAASQKSTKTSSIGSLHNNVVGKLDKRGDTDVSSAAVTAKEPVRLIYNDGLDYDVNGCISHSTLLLNDIQNIDENDDGNLVLVSEYVNDIYSYMYNLEMTYPIKENFLENHVDVTPQMRAVLIDWINEVHFQYKLIQETFFMAVAIIDRYLQIVTTIKRSHLQLVGVTALFIASKYEELYPPEIKDFVYITDETYNRQQILDMERHIVKKLDFQLGRPLPIHFLRRYSKAANSEQKTHQMAKYFIELMSIQYSFVHYRPSEMAAAALLLAQHIQTHEPINQIWNKTLQYYSTHTTPTLLPIVNRLANTIKSVGTTKLRAVFNKYKSLRCDEIALHPELSGKMIDTLCTNNNTESK